MEDALWFASMLIILLITLAAVLTWAHARHMEQIEAIKHTPTEYQKARVAYEQAMRNFDEVDPQYIDIAISDLGISENRVNNELRKLRLEGGEGQ